MNDAHGRKGTRDVVDARETVNQLVFRWDAQNPSGGTGFGVVAWSGRQSTAENIQRTVGSVLEVAGENAVPGLVRLEHNDSVLLGRRTLGRDPGGRAGTICHALVGPKTKLTLPHCLALHAWRWQEDDLQLDSARERLPPVPFDLLTGQVAEGQDQLTAVMREPGVARTLVAVTAEVLRNPKRRFSVLDHSGGRDPYAVLWGLYGMFGPLLHGHPLGWSFATHDTDDTKPLRFTFLAAWPTHPSANEQRVRLNPERRREDQAEQVAAELVERHLAGSPPGTVAEILTQTASREDARGGRTDWLLRTAERALSRIPAAPRTPPVPTPPVPTPPVSTPPVPTSPVPTSPVPSSPYPSRPTVPPPSQGRHDDPLNAVTGTGQGDDQAEELLRVVRRIEVEHADLPGLLDDVAARSLHWPRDLRLRFCQALLDRRLFLRAVLADTEEEHADVAARLYQQAVRPFVGDREVTDRLRNILPEEWQSAGGHHAARAALSQILREDPGLPDEIWYELFRAAARTDSGRRPSPSVSVPVAPPVEPPESRSAAPSPGPTWVREPQPREPQPLEPQPLEPQPLEPEPREESEPDSEPSPRRWASLRSTHLPVRRSASGTPRERRRHRRRADDDLVDGDWPMAGDGQGGGCLVLGLIALCLVALVVLVLWLAVA